MTSVIGAGAGFVSLVGAGPGDPDLITRRGLLRLQEADAVVHDRLVARELFSFCRPGVELYDVGKLPGSPCSTHQDDINALLVRLGRHGQRVVRLKGGDPFVFGRGGEEALALAAAGIPFEIVPGVSSAIAAPAAAGIPVTHRGISTSVTIVTGHGERGMPDHDWEALARMRGTLVFLMAMEPLERIVGNLMAHGRSPEEPTAIVQWGTLPWQRAGRAPLRDIPSTAREEGISSPAVLVIGDTVSLADVLAQATMHHEPVAAD